MRFAWLIGSFLLACGGDATNGGDDTTTPDADPGVPGSSDPLEGLPTGVEQWTNLCAQGYGDMITSKFCTGRTAPPVITSIRDLQLLLGLDATDTVNTRVTLTGHSTGLGLRAVTPLNPRAFVMTVPNQTAPNPMYQVMAFARGEPFVELVANDPQAGTLRFFLIRFHPACETTLAGCNNADMFTPSIESGWTDYTIYDDVTIKNTTLDCLNCHQPGGTNAQKMLRMQELPNPWAHWFYIEHQSNAATMQDFHAAHGTEDYAGIPNARIDPSRPINLQRLVSNNGFSNQPNLYDTNVIEGEIAANGASATWDAMYAKTVAGVEIPTPYHHVQTDPAKVAPAIAAYQQVMAGTLARDQLPDISDTLLDAALADMSIRPKAGLDGKGILQHMCQMCHNSTLDQSITRARFDVQKLSTLSRGIKDEAIRRLQLPDADRKHMPPVRFHTLSDAERDLAIAELQK
jgi:hypothetical protein